MERERESEPEFIKEDCDTEAEKEVKQPLFSAEVFKDDLELGKEDLDKLPI